MSETTPLWVEYPADDPSVPSVVVERLDEAAVDENIARGAIRLVRDAYTPQYGDVQVPTSVIRKEYDPDNSTLVALRRSTMSERIQTGNATYWVVRGEEPDQLDGLVRMMHSPYSSYIGDIITTPPWRRGIGSCALHAALAQTEYGPRHALTLDGFQGSGVNKWYEALGFEPRQLSGHLQIGSHSMLMREYATPSWVGKGGVLKALEAKRPRLAQAIVHTVPPQR